MLDLRNLPKEERYKVRMRYAFLIKSLQREKDAMQRAQDAFNDAQYYYNRTQEELAKLLKMFNKGLTP